MTRGRNSFPTCMETIEEQIDYMQNRNISDMDLKVLKSLKLLKKHYCNPKGENVVISLSKEDWKELNQKTNIWSKYDHD